MLLRHALKKDTASWLGHVPRHLADELRQNCFSDQLEERKRLVEQLAEQAFKFGKRAEEEVAVLDDQLTAGLRSIEAERASRAEPYPSSSRPI